MPFVVRDKNLEIVGMCVEKSNSFPEKVDANDPDFLEFWEQSQIISNDSLINIEMQRITREQAIKNLKQRGELPAEYDERR